MDMDIVSKETHYDNYKRKIGKYIDMLHGSACRPRPYIAYVGAPFDCEIDEVLVKKNTNLITGQPILKVRVLSKLLPFQTSSEVDKSKYKKILDQHTRVGACIMEDVSLNLIASGTNNVSGSRPLETLDNEAVLKRYQSFKKFDVVVDHSDHLFTEYLSVPIMRKQEWYDTIEKDRRILEKHLPETIFVRAYESRMELLRAVIVGQKGTPYQDGLFVFDVIFPDKYPNCLPIVRYHSGGLGINPSMNHYGEVSLKLFSPTGEHEQLWTDGRNTLELLVYIQDLILNAKPFFNGFVDASFEGSVPGEWLALLYNENTIIKTLKTMVNTMEKPPKNFEDLVFGHYRKHVRDILTACRGYIEGHQSGCLVSSDSQTCSVEFKSDVVSFIKPLIDAFMKIGAKEAEEFLYLIKKRKATDEDIHDTVNKQMQANLDVVDKNRKDIGRSHGSENCYMSWNIFSYSAGVVQDVQVKKGMRIKKGQALYITDLAKEKEVIAPTSLGALTSQSSFWKILSRNSRSRVGIFSMEDVLVDQDDGENSPMEGIDNEDVLKRFKNLKRFETVMDHSDHCFSAQSPVMNQPPEDWTNKIYEEWKILDKDLPENIYVRVYESRIDLLRAVIIGPVGTPYHNGLFFFDVCFPSNYPNSPPLVHYHSCGLSINPNLYKDGKVRLSLPRKSDSEEEMLWVPGTSTVFQLLLSIQNRVFNAKPLFNDLTYAITRGSLFGEQCSYLYNENICLKSLKIMTCIINQPPKNFEDFVMGHFFTSVHDIISMACSKKCSEIYRDNLFSCLGPLLDASRKMGVKEDQLTILGNN